jgi:hypothetical protein
MPRKPRKRGGKSAKRGLSAEQIPVIVARDREGSTTDAVLPRLNRVSIAAALGVWSRPPINSVAMAATPLSHSPARPASRHTSCQRLARQAGKLQAFISTTSMPTMDG